MVDEVWVRKLTDGTVAVALPNLGNSTATMTVCLEALGWKELMPWEEGLKRTVEWYKTYSVRYANIEQALVAHPRIESAVSAI